MPRHAAEGRLRVYRALSLIPLSLAATALLNVIVLLHEVGVFGGTRHHIPSGRMTAGLTMDAFMLGAIIMAVAVLRTRDLRTARNATILTYALFAAGIVVLPLAS